MKIITKAFTGDRIVGKFTCTGCNSELEVHISDCTAGVAGDYSGDREAYVAFRCVVCGKSNPVGLGWYEAVVEYQRVTKAIEEKTREELRVIEEKTRADMRSEEAAGSK